MKSKQRLITIFSLAAVLVPSFVQALTMSELQNYDQSLKQGKVLGASTGQSLVMMPSLKGLVTLPNNAVFQNLNSFRFEGEVQNFVSHNTPVGLMEVDSSMGVYIDSSNYLTVNNFGCNQFSLPIGSATAFQFVAQRNVAGNVCSLEIWNEQNGDYIKTTSPLVFNGTFNKSNYRLSVGSFYESASPDARVGYLRWYGNTKALGGQPPAFTVSTPADLVDYEFEGNSLDSSANGLS